MVDEAHAMVRFVAETDVPGTDASYHLPAFYELWSRWGPVEDRAFWAMAADVSRDVFVKVVNPQTGLAPDRSYDDASAMQTWDGQPYPFGYDSWRTASNWSVDAGWWGKDTRQKALSDAIQGFLTRQGIHTFPTAICSMASRSPPVIRRAWWRPRLWRGWRARPEMPRAPSCARSGTCRHRRGAALFRRHALSDEHDASLGRIPHHPASTDTPLRRRRA
jgi:hypothetical protein